MVQLTSIKLKNLLEFVESNTYLQFINKPISLSRVHSYINNKHANKEDVVLYMAFLNDKLVGYRTILSDIFYQENTKQKFGWLSGNWVHPKYRRKNISTKLFNEVLKDWNSRLMYSNYAEESKAVYDKTGTFTTLKSLYGIRYYRRACLADVLPPKHPFFKRTKIIWGIIDWFFNLISDVRFYKKTKLPSNIQKITDWNVEVLKFMSPFKQKEFFRRDEKSYKWIANYPWMQVTIDAKKVSNTYYFSSYAQSFQSTFYVVRNQQTNKIDAIINISIRDQKMKIPYFYSLDTGIESTKKLVLHLARINKVNHLTIYHKKLQNSFIDTFAIHKKFIQNYFITKRLLQEFPKINSCEIQTGDGDGVFT